VHLVLPEDDLTEGQSLLYAFLGEQHGITIVAGGTERQDSVFNGLLSCPVDTGLVLIHDGVRPFIESCTIDALLDQARDTGAAIPVTPLQYTLKRVRYNRVCETIPRENLYLVHTPQVFDYRLIMEAHRKAREDNRVYTDDAGMVEAIGHDVSVVIVSEPQIKITRPSDLPLAEFLLKSQNQSGRYPEQ
jgi:2-C-methyl-D-erythritol 4-phosphate cytidylyltransferase